MLRWFLPVVSSAPRPVDLPPGHLLPPAIIPVETDSRHCRFMRVGEGGTPFYKECELESINTLRCMGMDLVCHGEWQQLRLVQVSAHGNLHFAWACMEEPGESAYCLLAEAVVIPTIQAEAENVLRGIHCNFALRALQFEVTEDGEYLHQYRLPITRIPLRDTIANAIIPLSLLALQCTEPLYQWHRDGWYCRHPRGIVCIRDYVRKREESD